MWVGLSVRLSVHPSVCLSIQLMCSWARRISQLLRSLLARVLIYPELLGRY